MESPVLWIRLDPDMSLLRAVEISQPDYQWQYQLRHERDVTAQVGSPLQLSSRILVIHFTFSCHVIDLDGSCQSPGEIFHASHSISFDGYHRK